jgi:hypothetical protein
MNYTRALEFFIENGISLNKEQLEALKEEFLQEAANDQKEDDNDHFEDNFGKPYNHDQFKKDILEQRAKYKELTAEGEKLNKKLQNIIDNI